MTAKLLQDVGAAAIGHRLGHEIADAVGMQRIAPEHLHVLRLSGEMRLVINTTDISQLESLNVTRPPVPALLPENASILSKKRGSRQVTVNDSQYDSGIER